MIASSVLATAALFPFLTHVEAAEYPAGMIANESVNIRKGATTSYSIVDTLKPGEKATVIAEFENSVGEKWYNVDLGNVKGWGLSEFFQSNNSVESSTTVAPPPPATQQKVVLISGEIKKGASKSYPTVGTVSAGQNVKIIDTFKNSLGETWYRLDMTSYKGWVNSIVFEKSSTPLPPANIPEKGDKVYTINNYVKARSGATTSYKVVATLSINKALTVVDTFNNANGDTWIRVQLSTNTYGWIPLAELRTTPLTVKNLYVSVDGTNLRSGPSLSSSVVETANKGTHLTSLEKSGEWYLVVTSDNQYLWAHQSVVSDKQLVTSSTKYVSSSTAVIRKGASPQYSIVETLKQNSKLTVLDQFTNSLQQVWLQVKTASGKTGWILESQTTNQSTNSLTNPTYNGTSLILSKPSSVKLSYTTLSNNRLKITGNLNQVVEPNSSIKGIESIEKSSNSLILTFQPGYTFTIRNNDDNLSIKILPTGLKGKKIVIDAGHGGKDAGAVGPTGFYEKTANLATALKLQTELTSAGAIVKLTRSTDVFLELSERTSIANNSDYDAFISIHADSFNAASKGSTTYYNTTVNFNGPRSEEMAKDIQDNMIKSLGTYDRGVKEQSFYVNRMNELPSILVELAFISNPKEEALLKSSTFQQKAAVGIKNGLEEYFSNF